MAFSEYQGATPSEANNFSAYMSQSQNARGNVIDISFWFRYADSASRGVREKALMAMGWLINDPLQSSIDLR